MPTEGCSVVFPWGTKTKVQKPDPLCGGRVGALGIGAMNNCPVWTNLTVLLIPAARGLCYQSFFACSLSLMDIGYTLYIWQSTVFSEGGKYFFCFLGKNYVSEACKPILVWCIRQYSYILLSLGCIIRPAEVMWAFSAKLISHGLRCSFHQIWSPALWSSLHINNNKY